MTWQEVWMGTAGMVFALVLIVVTIVQVGATWRARKSVAREDAFRALVHEATQAHQRTAQELERVHAELSALRERTTAMEKLLKEVEEPWAR